jgi:hypothetical protein
MRSWDHAATGDHAMFTRSNLAKIVSAPEIVLILSFVGIFLAFISAASAFA